MAHGEAGYRFLQPFKVRERPASARRSHSGEKKVKKTLFHKNLYFQETTLCEERCSPAALLSIGLNK